MRLQRRLVLFVAVGSVAALVHWLVVVALVEGRQLAPLVANVVGWLTAFVVSFGGHRRWTFEDQGAPAARSARRFFAVSAAGFAVNEGTYAALLHGTGWRYDLVLVIVLLAVAALTYLASRRWAFAAP